jgi:hypothetical protein
MIQVTWMRRAGMAILFLLLFWLAAILGSGIPALHQLAVSVDGLSLADYGSELNAVIAPLSGRIYEDVYRDSKSNSHVSWQWFGPLASPGATTTSPSPATSPGPGGPSPTPTSGATPAPSPGVSPSGSVSPTATATATPSGSPAPTPSSTPTPTPGQGSVSGRVVDAGSNVGISGASISLSPGGAATTSGTNGSFTLTLSPGTYSMTVSAPGHISTTQGVTVTNGKKTNVTVRLVNASSAGTVQGRVIDSASGLAMAGATVSLSPNGATATTDVDGYYSLGSVQSGRYNLSVQATNYFSQNVSVTVVTGQSSTEDFQLVHR